jgi:hypothetical protein
VKSITIRGIDGDLDQVIKSRARQDNLSVNQWIVNILKTATGTGKATLFKEYHDLDALAGGWSEEEAKTFLKGIEIFERIDEDIWT